MKKKAILITVIFALFCLPFKVLAQPVAVVEKPVFTFESTAEGLHVKHVFIIKNTGDTPLNLLKVSPP
jgi:hypothetical protein